MKTMRVLVGLGALVGLIAWSHPAFAQDGLVSSPVGSAVTSSVTSMAPGDDWDEFEIELESPHPYENNADLWYEFSYPGASAIKVYFEKVETESCCDAVGLYDSGRTEQKSYKGTTLGFWGEPVSGDQMFVRLTSDFSVVSFGFKITKMAVQF